MERTRSPDQERRSSGYVRWEWDAALEQGAIMFECAICYALSALLLVALMGLPGAVSQVWRNE